MQNARMRGHGQVELMPIIAIIALLFGTSMPIIGMIRQGRGPHTFGEWSVVIIASIFWFFFLLAIAVNVGISVHRRMNRKRSGP